MILFLLRILSRVLLVLEGAALALPSLFGSMVLFGGMIAFIYKQDVETVMRSIFCVLAACTFYAFWHIYFDVLANKFSNGKLMNKYVSGFALIGGVFSVVSLILLKLSVKHTGMDVFSLGVFYVPTYLHLLLEVNRQTKGTCITFSKASSNQR